MGSYEDLEGKGVLITGGAGGIGLATALRFAEEGSTVVIVDRDAEALDRALAENKCLQGGIRCDVSDPDQVSAAFEQADEIIGDLDVLISNAGISRRRPFLEIDYRQWSEVLRVNLDGMFLCAREAIARMERRRTGVVLMTASTNGLEGHPFYADYNASKAGVVVLAKTLALEFAPWLRVNAVCPGYVLTPMQEAEYTPEKLEQINAGIPAGRHAAPEEVAALFAFLASDQAAFITGQAVTIDGGETAGLGSKP